MSKTEGTTEKKFSKARIIKDGAFNDYVDIVNVVLDNNKEYSLTEVRMEIEKFLKRKVN